MRSPRAYRSLLPIVLLGAVACSHLGGRARTDRHSTPKSAKPPAAFSHEWVIAPRDAVTGREYRVAPLCGDYNSPVIERHGRIYWAYIGYWDDYDGGERASAHHPIARRGQSDVVHQEVYDDQSLCLAIAQRDPLGVVIRRVIRRGVYNDAAHVVPSVGVDLDGYIHVGANMVDRFSLAYTTLVPEGEHHDPWVYYVSRTPLDVGPGFLNRGKVGADGVRHHPPHQGVTYLNFLNDRQGRLYASYKHRLRGSWDAGTNAGGLARYHEESRTWASIGGRTCSQALDHPTLFASAGGPGNPRHWVGVYQPYKQSIVFDSNNRMHVSAMIYGRLGSDSHDGFTSNAVYAYSDDLGETFRRADGTSVSLPMTVTRGESADDSGLMAEGNSGVVYRTHGGWSGQELAYKVPIILTGEDPGRVTPVLRVTVKEFRFEGKSYSLVRPAEAMSLVYANHRWTEVEGIDGLNFGHGLRLRIGPFNSGFRSCLELGEGLTGASPRVLVHRDRSSLDDCIPMGNSSRTDPACLQQNRVLVYQNHHVYNRRLVPGFEHGIHRVTFE